jgi:predicted ABC-class ATPase
MQDSGDLAKSLRTLDGRGYKAYKEVQGTWAFPGFVLYIDHVQGDPFAEPSRIRLLLPHDFVDLPDEAFRSPARALGTAALLARTFSWAARRLEGGAGSGKSGEFRMEDPGQLVLPQTAVQVHDDGSVEARFTVGMPANGRRILGHEAARLFETEVPTLISSTLRASAHADETLRAHAEVNEDADALRAALPESGLIGFVADGAHLPRISGIDERPLQDESLVPFQAPESMSVTIEVPNAGALRGMGVRPGVTLIVGGGFHGKSTLLRALESGVYNHRPGDGREFVVSRVDAVKVRAEDGRSVAGVDISSFIGALPYGRDTTDFSTPNASGSTSQAATIVEAIEAGAGVLLVDEDTSATNFMIRDRRMQELVPKSGEPITPFVDRVRGLHNDLDVSCVLVIGGSGDYLDVAHHVVRMDGYRPHDATDRAHSIASDLPTGRTQEEARVLSKPAPRMIAARSLDPRRGRRDRYIRVPDGRTLLFGTQTIDLAAIEQLMSRPQIRAIGGALSLISGLLRNHPLTVSQALDAIEQAVEADGLDTLEPRRTGGLAAFRRMELASVLNRVRSLCVD